MCNRHNSICTSRTTNLDVGFANVPSMPKHVVDFDATNSEALSMSQLSKPPLTCISSKFQSKEGLANAPSDQSPPPKMEQYFAHMQQRLAQQLQQQRQSRPSCRSCSGLQLAQHQQHQQRSGSVNPLEQSMNSSGGGPDPASSCRTLIIHGSLSDESWAR